MTATLSTPTGQLAAAVGDLRYADLPPSVVTIAKQCLLDVLGAMLAGSREPAGRIIAELMTRDGATGPCTLAGHGGRASTTTAALVNGTAGHALDYDDVISSVGHPSVAVAPAVLAVGERSGSGGRDVLAAFVAGVETQARVGAAVGPEHYARGFHSTATFGSFGAAVAAARLSGVDGAGMVAALGIAGTQAAGLKAVFGTMCKPLHAGRAAANGVLAAELAAGGFTSADDILGDPQGFAVTQSDRFDAAVLDAPLGEPWRMYEMRFKVHAACFLTHPAIDSLRALAREHGFGTGEVARIEVAVPPGQLRVCGIEAPRTGLEGKFSLRATAALALLRPALGPETFTDETVTAPEVVALRDKVTVTADSALSGPVARVAVWLAGSGSPLEAYRDMRLPAWVDDPAEQTPQLLAKFHALADPVVGPERAGSIARCVSTLDSAASVRPLCELLHGE